MSSPTSSQFETAVMVRRILFFLVLISLTLLNLMPLFRGLSSPQAMEQAAIGREIARGNGATTKMIRPLAYYEAEKANGGAVSFKDFRDTYHAPLNPLILGAVLKMVGGDKAEAWAIPKDQQIFPLDRAVALVSTLFFLMSIGVCYLLIGRIFDPKIAGVTVILMMLCDLFWSFSQSGLPQMLLLLLFSCGLYFTYRAIEAQEEGRPCFGPALLGAAFFGLMVLAHWIAMWIFLGYLVYAAFAFKPRGIIALVGIVLLGVMIAYPLIRANGIVGQPFGTGFYVLYNGIGGGTESVVMRNHDLESEPLSLDGLIVKILGTTLVQASDLLPFLGGILAAPFFFIALLHPFKRPSIAGFRWGILIMWAFAALGMAIFGIDRENPLHPNQIHLLFAPVMAAYGLAFISIMWSRLEVVATNPFLRNVHFVILIILSAAPMVLTLPNKVQLGMHLSKGGVPHWPPYVPSVLNKGIPQILAASGNPTGAEERIVVSDQPWAVAWYADTLSLWLPTTKKGFEKLEDRANSLGTPFAGFLMSPYSTNGGTVTEVRRQFGEFNSLVFNGVMSDVSAANVQTGGVSIAKGDPKLAGILRRYDYPMMLSNGDLVFYGQNTANQRQESK